MKDQWDCVLNVLEELGNQCSTPPPAAKQAFHPSSDQSSTYMGIGSEDFLWFSRNEPLHPLLVVNVENDEEDSSISSKLLTQRANVCLVCGSSMVFAHSAAWKYSEKDLMVNFSHAYSYCGETAIVSWHTLPVGFSLPTVSKNSLCALFCSLILDHGVLKISTPKILVSNFLLDTSFHHSFQSVIIRSQLLMCLHVIQFQYGLKFVRLSYS